MKPLSVTDASFLYTETDSTPMTVASVQLLTRDDYQREPFLASLKALILERKHLVQYLNHKPVFAPGRFDHPEWIEDPDFDIDNHVYAVDVGGQGSMADLEALIARLHSERFDRSRPLWRLLVIDGLADGRIAYYHACSHACIDGQSGQIAIQLLMDLQPEPRREPAPASKAPTAPSPTRLAGSAWARLVRATMENWRQLPAQLSATAQTSARLTARAFDPRKNFGAYGQLAPRTSLNQSIDAERTFAVGRIPLADVKAIGKATDAKVNDVFLAIAAGGLTRYLERRGELPRSSLIAGCPVSLREAGDTSLNNQVTMMLVSLATDIDDPRARLKAIRESSLTAKEIVAELAPAMPEDVRFFGLPGMIRNATRSAEWSRVADRAPMAFNLVISNVPGPQVQLYSNGAAMQSHFPVSIPVHGQGMNLTVQSYLGNLDFSLTAGKKALKDAGQLRDELLAAFFELRAEILGKPGEVDGWDASVAPWRTSTTESGPLQQVALDEVREPREAA
jgi:diacylglycerol O-acyltransferase